MAATARATQELIIKAPDIRTAEFLIQGTAPYVQHKFSQKARQKMLEAQQAGSKSRSRKTREARDLDADYKGAMHISKEGWHGIPAPSFRSAMIDACRLVGFKMTHAKISVFVEPDGFDADDGTPLVKIVKGEPRPHTGAVRNETGVADIRCRPLWDEGWQAMVRIAYDADQFSAADVSNLLMRAGLQVGVGEGRPNSKKSHGMGWGTFRHVGGES